MPQFRFLFTLCLFLFSIYARTIYLPHLPEPHLLQVTGARNGSLATDAPDWINVRVLESAPAGPLKQVTFEIKCEPTTTPRVGTVKVSVGISEYEFTTSQAGELSVSSDGEITTEQFDLDTIRKVWFVPEDKRVIPDIAFTSTLKGLRFELDRQKGWLYVQTDDGVYSAQLAN